MSAPAGGDVLRWYTRGLRIPKFIGRLATGEFIKGGPYPQSQVATFAAVIGLAVPGVEIVDVETTAKTIPDFPGMWHQMVGESKP